MYQVVKTCKFQKPALRGIQIHNARLKPEASHKLTNKDIDLTRTHLNYNLAPELSGTFYKKIKERLDKLPAQKSIRKDAVLMAEVVISASSEFFENSSKERVKQYFKDSYEFLKNRFGAENVVASYVHMDESVPHMHFDFVPIERERDKLCCKNVLNQRNLIDLHTDFHREVSKKYDLDRGQPRTRSGKKIYGLQQFKELTAKQKEVEKAQEKLNQEKSKRETEVDYIKRYKERVGLANADQMKVSKNNIDTLSQCLDASLSKILDQDRELKSLKSENEKWRSLSADELEKLALTFKKTNSKNYDDFKSKQKSVKKSRKTDLSVER